MESSKPIYISQFVTQYDLNDPHGIPNAECIVNPYNFYVGTNLFDAFDMSNSFDMNRRDDKIVVYRAVEHITKSLHKVHQLDHAWFQVNLYADSKLTKSHRLDISEMIGKYETQKELIDAIESKINHERLPLWGFRK